MENDLRMDLSSEYKSSLPHWIVILPLFIVLTALINYVYFKDIFLVSEGRAEDFVFKNFLIYNLGLKAILYPFKFIALAGAMTMGLFLFKVDKIDFTILLKIVILSELVKYLPEVLKILWFTYADSNSLEGYEMQAFDSYLSMNGLIGTRKENAIYPLFKYLSITQVLYVLTVAQLLSTALNQKLSYHLHWFGITYGIIVLVLSLGSIVISL